MLTGSPQDSLLIVKARLAIDNGVPLNDSLTKEASALDGVEREHVQRIV